MSIKLFYGGLLCVSMGAVLTTGCKPGQTSNKAATSTGTPGVAPPTQGEVSLSPLQGVLPQLNHGETNTLMSAPGQMVPIKDGDAVYVPVPQLPGMESGLNLASTTTPEVVTVHDQTFNRSALNTMSKITLSCSDAAFNESINGDASAQDHGGWMFYVRARRPKAGIPLQEAYLARKNNAADAETKSDSTAFAKMLVYNIKHAPSQDPAQDTVLFCPGVMTSVQYFNKNEDMWLEGLFVKETDDGQLDVIFSRLLSDLFKPGAPKNKTRFIETRLLAENTQLVSSVAADSGALIAVGADNQVYSRLSLTAPWVRAGANANKVTAIAALAEGSFLGISSQSPSIMRVLKNLDDTFIDDPVQKQFKTAPYKDAFVFSALEVDYNGQLLGVRRPFKGSQQRAGSYEEPTHCAATNLYFTVQNERGGCHTLLKRNGLAGEWVPETRVKEYQTYLSQTDFSNETLPPRPGRIKAVADMPNGSMLLAAIEAEYYDASDTRLKLKTLIADTLKLLEVPAIESEVTTHFSSTTDPAVLQLAKDRVADIKKHLRAMKVSIDVDMASLLSATSPGQGLKQTRIKLAALFKALVQPVPNAALSTVPSTTPKQVDSNTSLEGLSLFLPGQTQTFATACPSLWSVYHALTMGKDQTAPEALLSDLEKHGKPLIVTPPSASASAPTYTGSISADYGDAGRVHRRMNELDRWEVVPYNQEDYVYKSKIYDLTYTGGKPNFFKQETYALDNNGKAAAEHPCLGVEQKEPPMATLTVTHEGVLVGVHTDDRKLYTRYTYQYSEGKFLEITDLQTRYMPDLTHFDSQKGYLTLSEFDAIKERQIAERKNGKTSKDYGSPDLTEVFPYDCVPWQRVEQNNDMPILSVTVMK